MTYATSPRNARLTAQNPSKIARSTPTHIETPPEVKRSQNAKNGAYRAILDEERIWRGKEQIIASVPEKDQVAVKLGILEEYILYGIRNGKDIRTFFLLAALGLSLANNDRPFFDEVQSFLSQEKSSAATL